MQKIKEKDVLILSVIGVITLIIVVIGATYAYFQATSSDSQNVSANVSSNTTDNLSFSIGNPIYIRATEENFAQGMGSLASSTTASATLTANNYTNNATRNYYVYLNITSNNFEYTTVDNQTELFLSITDPQGNPVTSIDGLTPVSVGDVEGFDITTETGLIMLADNYEITTTGTTTQEWNITVTFVNLNSDQNANTEKSFDATLIMQENAPVRITNVTTSSITNNSITLTVDATSENTITNYYYAIGDNDFVSSTSNTYTFDNLDANTEYTFRVYVVDSAEAQSAIYNISESTTSPSLFADYIKNNVYTGDGNEGIYYPDGVGDYTNASEEAGDNSYRYSGATPDNYVCFGSDEEVCPNENLYRIIGVFGDQIKLIKHDYVNSTMLGTDGDFYNASYLSTNSTSDYYRGSQDQSDVSIYYWSRTGINTWSASELNTINLNTNYINYLNNQNSKWNEMIETTNWIVGGNIGDNIYAVSVKNTYTNEIVSPATNTTHSAKIGLMYVSDYGYAASPENWATTLADYDNDTSRDNNWLFMGLREWTITSDSDVSYFAFIIYDTGYVNRRSVVGNIFGSLRPTFYLKSNVILADGTGTSTNPYRLSYDGA